MSLRQAPNFPLLVRAAPFLLFTLLTAGQGQFGESSRYWIYFLKTILGAGMVWAVRPWIPEMRWQFSGEAVLAGVGVFAIWVGLDGWYPSVQALCKGLLCPLFGNLGLESWCHRVSAEQSPWNPHREFGQGLAWTFILSRLLGSSLVVPPLEEVFYRSFIYRYIQRPDFEAVPLNRLHWPAFFVTSLIFGFAHYEWLPGILCGMIYQALVLRSNDLGQAMTAHGITNFLLGLWIVWKGAWHFW